MTYKNVLVVEDELLVANNLKTGLEGLGYNVPTFLTSGEKAIQHVDEMPQKPDIVLMDIQLNGPLDGIQAAEYIHNNHDIPVVFLTAYSEERVLQRALKTMPYGYIVKPYMIKEVHSAIQIAINKYKQEGQLKETERWITSTLKSFAYAVITVDSRGVIKYVNSYSESLIGWNQKEVLGKNLLEVFKIININSSSSKENPVLKAITDGISHKPDYETVLLAKDGTKKSINYYTTPISESNGSNLGAVIIFQPVRGCDSNNKFKNQDLNNFVPAKNAEESFADRPPNDLEISVNNNDRDNEFKGTNSSRGIIDSIQELPQKRSKQSGGRPPGFEKIIGNSPAILHVMNIIKQIENTNSNVLITGKTGTGKDLIARTIHNHSLRKGKNFVPLVCVAIPSNLLESELFGFEKGAFTGAFGRKYGLLEFAHEGTVFLNEISELEPNLQAKLLEVIQERQFRRIGGKELIQVDLRVIAAMNKNPKKELSENRLRKDLYYRLNVIQIHIPSLNKRKEDIPLIANHFLKSTLKKNYMEHKEISNNAMDMLMEYKWPGNVRQLQNIIERLVILSRNTDIDVDDLPDYIKSKNSYQLNNSIVPIYRMAKKNHLDKFERKYFKKILEETNFNISKAAKIAGISYRTIYRAMKRYGNLL